MAQFGHSLAPFSRETSALVDFIMSRVFPVSASLTGEDKAGLLQIKQDAEKNSHLLRR
jgi:hypothetical protein